MISILILTYNEEKNLTTCLKSVKWSNDIVILDSYSTDSTINIANAYDVRIIQRKFDNYAAQRNYGLSEIQYKNEWVLMLDADEVLTKELTIEIENTIKSTSPDFTLFRVRRKDFFFSKWIKHAGGYPTWFGRLVRPNRITVKRAINEEYHTDGKVGHLSEHLLHFPFNKGISNWVSKHNQYSSMEAELLVAEDYNKSPIQDLWSKDPVVRRKLLKKLIYKMPGRPVLIFFSLYIFRLGFIDGKEGFVYCILRAYYEFLINLKVKEIRMRKIGRSI